MTPYTNPENSWTKRFASKQKAQISHGSGDAGDTSPHVVGPGSSSLSDPKDPTKPYAEGGAMIEDDEALDMIEKLIPYAEDRLGGDMRTVLEHMKSTILEVHNMDEEGPEMEMGGPLPPNNGEPAGDDYNVG